MISEETDSERVIYADLTQFDQVFFDESDEHLSEMEWRSLPIDPANPEEVFTPTPELYTSIVHMEPVFKELAAMVYLTW